LTYLSDLVLNGLTLGAEYALVAAGLALIFGVLEIVSFAHGEFFMVGAYLLFVFVERGRFAYWAAAPAAVLGMVAFGVIFYFAVVRRILNRGWQVQLVATLAVSIILVNAAIVIAGSSPRLVSSPLSGVILHFGSIRLSEQRLLVVGAAIVAFASLYAVLRYTKIGKAMRAVAQNREAATVVGIPIQRIGLAAVVTSSALAGVASATIAPLYNLQPTMGQLVVVKAFAAVIMGGFGNVTGAIVAAFVLGLVESLTIGYVTSDYADVLVFGVMLLTLLFRPQGLFGRIVRA
jgi:branched-chain amino acid transport system permease protein